jgi:hypothetical protein
MRAWHRLRGGRKTVTDIQRIDLLVQYAVAAAARAEFPDNRLGPIHILKYIYLADLAHAEQHGETFTGATWTFFHFGPWCQPIHARIEPAVRAAGFDTLKTEGEYGEFVRYTSRNRTLRDKLEPDLPISVSRAIDKAIRRYGTDTPALLEAVYLTQPMRLASPGGKLVLGGGEREQAEAPSRMGDAPTPGLTAKQEKNRAKKLRELKERVRAELAGSHTPTGAPRAYTPPRYDDIFERGTDALDEQLPSQVESCDFDLTFDESVWDSAMRRDEELP